MWNVISYAKNYDILQSHATSTIISAPIPYAMWRGAIESGWRIQARRIERRPHFEPVFQQKCGVLLRCIALVRARRPVNPSTDVTTFRKEEGKHGWRLAQSRACLISAYPFFAFRARPPPHPYVVNKRTFVDKGPAKISRRGPFRGNQCEFADSSFSTAGLAGLKKRESTNMSVLLLVISFAGMRRNRYTSTITDIIV